MLFFSDQEGCLSACPLRLRNLAKYVGKAIVFEAHAYIFYNLKFVY